MIEIEKLEQLYFKDRIRSKQNRWFESRRLYRSKSKTRNPYRIARHILNNNIGQSFAQTFAYYCSKVPKYYQHIFLEEFKPQLLYKRYYDEHYIDENDLIQIHVANKNKKIYKIYSDDYKVTYRLKYLKRYQKINDKLLEFDKLPCYSNKNDYDIVIYGTITEYSSRRHPDYVAYKRKLKRKAILEWRLKKKDKKEYNINAIANEKKRLSAEQDLLKRNAAGFDDQSFIGEGYHGRKNKYVL